MNRGSVTSIRRVIQRQDAISTPKRDEGSFPSTHGLIKPSLAPLHHHRSDSPRKGQLTFQGRPNATSSPALGRSIGKRIVNSPNASKFKKENLLKVKNKIERVKGKIIKEKDSNRCKIARKNFKKMRDVYTVDEYREMLTSQSSLSSTPEFRFPAENKITKIDLTDEPEVIPAHKIKKIIMPKPVDLVKR